MKKLTRRKELFIVFFTGFFSMAVIAAAGIFIYANFFQGGSTRVNAKGDIKKVIAASGRITKGELISADNIKISELPANKVPVNSEIDINMVVGKKASVTLDENVVITAEMYINPQKGIMPDERIIDFELGGGLAAANIKEGDSLDVEFIRPDGDTSCVLSKKTVLKRQENKIMLRLGSLERRLMNSAYAEQSARGGKIETVVYIDDTQPPSKVTYKPQGNFQPREGKGAGQLTLPGQAPVNDSKNNIGGIL